jgi:hypothetical protein
MYVAALAVELHLPESHSLKDKRAIIKPVLEGCRRRYQVAAAETGHQELWQRASLAFATVGAQAGHLSEVLDNVDRFVWSFPELEVLSTERCWLSPEPA